MMWWMVVRETLTLGEGGFWGFEWGVSGGCRVKEGNGGSSMVLSVFYWDVCSTLEREVFRLLLVD